MQSRQSLTGEVGLILAVIDQAARDYQSGGPHAKTAAAYFRGKVYQHHLTTLGLDPGTMPLVVQRGRLSEQNATQKEAI